jgi:hypothetical protein
MGYKLNPALSSSCPTPKIFKVFLRVLVIEGFPQIAPFEGQVHIFKRTVFLYF